MWNVTRLDLSLGLKCIINVQLFKIKTKNKKLLKRRHERRGRVEGRRKGKERKEEYCDDF